VLKYDEKSRRDERTYPVGVLYENKVARGYITIIEIVHDILDDETAPRASVGRCG
jgi:disulfide oxidoreductase YuzD